jgi:hypothetical protein
MRMKRKGSRNRRLEGRVGMLRGREERMEGVA